MVEPYPAARLSAIFVNEPGDELANVLVTADARHFVFCVDLQYPSSDLGFNK